MGPCYSDSMSGCQLAMPLPHPFYTQDFAKLENRSVESCVSRWGRDLVYVYLEYLVYTEYVFDAGGRGISSGKKEGIFIYYNLYYKCSTNYSKQKYPLFRCVIRISKRCYVCRSIGPLVRWSIGPLVHRTVAQKPPLSSLIAQPHPHHLKPPKSGYTVAQKPPL